MKLIRNVLIAITCMLLLNNVKAASGDTTYVKVFDKYHMGNYGFHDKKALAPAASFNSQRIWMKYTIGCTSNGQCEWDYTVKMLIRQHTGKYDSTLKQAPSFKVVGGAAKDTVLYYESDTTWSYTKDSASNILDSVRNNPYKVAMFRDTLHPLVCTDTLLAWPPNTIRFATDTTGKFKDTLPSVSLVIMKVTYRSYYNVFEIINDYEMGRMISPYAANIAKTFAFEHMFDVTDFASLLHDSIEVRIKYEGYTFGFTSTVEFYFIEGVPAREPMAVQSVYNNYYNYGQATSIETALNQQTIKMPVDASSAKIRILITGHGGESSEGCAEFCAKSYYLKMNNALVGSNLVWKDDCGANAFINQGGTWVYDRGNWCPGEKVRVFEHELNLTPGNTATLDMDMDPFTASGGAGYNISAIVVYYKDWVREDDAAVEDIIVPSKRYLYNRLNPACNNARILIRNMGHKAITSMSIKYVIGNAQPVTYNWTGTLASTTATEVSLPGLIWPSDNTQNQFKAEILSVNGGTDGNLSDNTMTSVADIPAVLPARFIIETTTNKKPQDNSFTIKDASGKTVYTRFFSNASVLNRDTIDLGLGCYTFEMIDQGKNGLAFWANNDGNGSLRIRTYGSPITVLKTFVPDFGNFTRLNFTVMYKVGMDEQNIPALHLYNIYPSPAHDKLFISFDGQIRQVIVRDLNGKTVLSSTLNDEGAIDIAGLPEGLYLLSAESDQGQLVTRKFTVSR